MTEPKITKEPKFENEIPHACCEEDRFSNATTKEKEDRLGDALFDTEGVTTWQFVFFGGEGETCFADFTGVIRCFPFSYSLYRQREKESHRCNDARPICKFYTTKTKKFTALQVQTGLLTFLLTLTDEKKRKICRISMDSGFQSTAFRAQYHIKCP